MNGQNNKITEIIKSTIKQKGYLNFADYMQYCLYTPVHGYYCRKNINVGEKGDFTTAPEISNLFGYCFAEQCIEVFEHSDIKEIIEIGAGSGKLAYDMLTHLRHKKNLPNKYYILEISETLKNKQQRKLYKFSRECQIIWLNKIEDINNCNAIIIANELFDALPFHLINVGKEKHNKKEKVVTLDSKNELTWKEIKIENKILAQEVDFLIDNYPQIRSNSYLTEINLNYQIMLQTIYNVLNYGIVIVVDYGYTGSQYYLAERSQGTFRCFYQHKIKDDPLKNIGLQDITSHVNFSKLAKDAIAVGYEVSAYTEQANFLLGNNLANVLQKQQDKISNQKLMYEAQALTMPQHMGEKFKVLLLSKNNDLCLQGFKLSNKIYTL